MLEEEERQRGGMARDFSALKPRRRLRRIEWPPKQNGIGNGVDNMIIRHPLLSSYRTLSEAGLKRIAWPPPPESQEVYIQEQPVYSKGPGYGDSFSSTLPRQPPLTWEPPAASAPSPQYQAQPPAHTYQPPLFEPPPTTVVLRPEPPISQAPPPIFTSQPAATRATGSMMRGDEKWPPAAHKARTQAENEARVALARGPAVRPRKINRDYGNFFAQNALTPNYPSYRAPPGTQHYVEEGTSNF